MFEPKKIKSVQLLIPNFFYYNYFLFEIYTVLKEDNIKNAFFSHLFENILLVQLQGCGDLFEPKKLKCIQLLIPRAIEMYYSLNGCEGEGLGVRLHHTQGACTWGLASLYLGEYSEE